MDNHQKKRQRKVIKKSNIVHKNDPKYLKLRTPGWQRGYAVGCRPTYLGSNPGPGFILLSWYVKSK